VGANQGLSVRQSVSLIQSLRDIPTCNLKLATTSVTPVQLALFSASAKRSSSVTADARSELASLIHVERFEIGMITVRFRSTPSW
jgi:hypothetical protein